MPDELCPICFPEGKIVDKVCIKCKTNFGRKGKPHKKKRILNDALSGVYTIVSKIKAHQLTGQKPLLYGRLRKGHR